MQGTSSFADFDNIHRQSPILIRVAERTSGCERVHQVSEYITEDHESSFALQAAEHEEQIASRHVSSSTPLQRLTTSDTGDVTGSREAMDRSGQVTTPSVRLLPGENGTQLSDRNFDDWTLYNDVFWQPTLSGRNGNSNGEFAECTPDFGLIGHVKIAKLITVEVRCFSNR